MENLEFTCVGLNDNGKFPVEYTGRGEDISPEFIINNLSPNAETLIITLEDMSHPIKRRSRGILRFCRMVSPSTICRSRHS